MAVEDYDRAEFKRLSARDRQYEMWGSMARHEVAASTTPLRTRPNPAIRARNALRFPGAADDHLRAYADELGVELAKLPAHQRATTEQVAAAAGLTVPALGQRVAAAGRPVALTQAGPMVQGGSGRVPGELGERNPLVKAAWLERSDLADQARQRGPEPTLFAAGDLPDFTASGVDPKVLLRVPWNARPTLAAEPDPVRVFAEIEKFNGVDADRAELLAKDEGLEGAAVAVYRQAVKAWLMAGLSEDQLMVSLGYWEGEQKVEQARADHNARSAGALPGGLPRTYPKGRLIASKGPEYLPLPGSRTSDPDPRVVG